MPQRQFNTCLKVRSFLKRIKYTLDEWKRTIVPHKTLFTSLCFVIGSFSPLAATHLDQELLDDDHGAWIVPRKKTTTLAFLKRHLLEQVRRHPERFNPKNRVRSGPFPLAQEELFDSAPSSPNGFGDGFPDILTPRLNSSGFPMMPQSPTSSYSLVPTKFEQMIDHLEQKIVHLEEKEKKLRTSRQSLLDALRDNENLLFSLRQDASTETQDPESLHAKIQSQSDYLNGELEKTRRRYTKVCVGLAKAKAKAKAKKVKLDCSGDNSPYLASRFHSRLNAIIQKRSGPPSILKTSMPNTPSSTTRTTPNPRRVSFNTQVFYSPLLSIKPHLNDSMESPSNEAS